MLSHPLLPRLCVIAGAVVAFALVVVTASASTTSVNATPSALTGTSSVRGVVGIPASGVAGGATQVITQTFDPTHLRLGGATDVTVPEGWVTTYSTDGVTFGAAPAMADAWAQVRAVQTTGTVTGTGAAATGGSTSQSVAPPPSGTFTAAGGGDGWDVFFDDDNHVFNVWHHNGNGGYAYGAGLGAVDCHTRTGDSCGSGWPFYMSATGGGGGGWPSRILNTGVHSTGWVSPTTGRLWLPTNDDGTRTGFACIDVSNLGNGAGQGPTWCDRRSISPNGTTLAESAFVVLGSAGPSGQSTGGICKPQYPWGCVDGLAVSGSRLYTTETRTGKILCVDTAANDGLGAACASQPYAFADANAAPTIWNGSTGWAGSWSPALLSVGGRVYGTALGSFTSTADPVLFCLVGSTGGACPGWAAAKSLPDNSWLTYAQPNAAGVISGICVRWVTTASPAGAPTCFTPDGASMTGNSAIASTWTQTTTSENASGTALTVGTRVLWGNADYNVPSAPDGNDKLFCSDAATNADCAGWPLSPYDNYAIVVDPLNDNCFWTNSHNGTIKQVNVTGSVGCNATPPTNATFTATSLVTTQRVSCVGSPTWGALTLTSPAQGAYVTATLTVLDANGSVVVSGGTTWRDVPLTAGAIDLTTLRQADTGSNPQFIVNLTGRTDSAAIATTITTPAYAPQLCLRLTPQEIPCPYATAPSGSLAAWTSAVAGAGLQGTAVVDSAEVSVSFANAATDACVPPAPPQPPAPEPTVAPLTPPIAPRVAAPRAAAGGRAVVTSVAVREPGVVTQRGVQTTGGAACASRAVVVRRPGVVTVTCVLTAAAASRVRTGAPVRIRLTTTLRTRSGTSTSVRVVTVRWRPEPVTG